jgi:hypothetical protein
VVKLIYKQWQIGLLEMVGVIDTFDNHARHKKLKNM